MLSIPVVRIQRPSDEPTDSTWHCCRCGDGCHIFLHPGEHPLGALACICPHKPCGNCKTSGLVKQFLPMEEPATIPLSSHNNRSIAFGVICAHCGLSWRAKEVGRHQKLLQKMPSLSHLPKSLRQLHQNRLAPENGRLRKSHSTVSLRGKRIVTPPDLGKQAAFATVNFTGIECTCGHVTDLNAFCFQIVGPPVDQHRARFLERLNAPRPPVGRATTPALVAMGHDLPEIALGGVRHANPLRSHPVM